MCIIISFGIIEKESASLLYILLKSIFCLEYYYDDKWRGSWCIWSVIQCTIWMAFDTKRIYDIFNWLEFACVTECPVNGQHEYDMIRFSSSPLSLDMCVCVCLCHLCSLRASTTYNWISLSVNKKVPQRSTGINWETSKQVSEQAMQTFWQMHKTINRRM